jgi:glycosyltransferase involved in cell wall biosynthesis
MNINLNCPIGATGYGMVGLNILKSLSQLGTDISLFPIGNNIELNHDSEKSLFEQCLSRANFFDYNAPCLKIWHQFDLASKIGNGKYYAFPFFEINRLNDKEKHHLNYVSKIFVASHWAKQILIENGINKQIDVVPLGVDTNIFRTPPKIKLLNNNYVFFHIGKWEIRKGHDFLLKAFDAAFDINDNVELRLLPHNPFLNEQETQQWFSLVQNCKLKDKIKIFGRLQTQFHLAEFISDGDCGVFPSRAEGWNHELLESMALNKPVIATNYSAHTEYINNNNCFMINVDELEPANDNKWFNGFGNWAKLGQNQFDQLVYYMKHVYNNNIRSNQNGVLTANTLNWTNTAKNILLNLSRDKNANSRKKTKRR